MVEKRESLKIWTVLLAIATFSFSLSGTFLVRSGILNSVHAFANDPARGIFILGLLALVIGGSLALFAYRAPTLTAGGLFAPISREGALVLNNILLCSLCAVVLTGTMYPPFMSLLFDRTISVGKPFFDATTIPLAIPLFIFMGFGPMLPWKRAQLWPVLQRLWIAALLAGVAFAVFTFGMSGILPILCSALAVWVIASSVLDITERVRLFRMPLSGSFQRARMLPRSIFGTAIAHAGVGVTVLGLAAMSQAQHKIVEVPVGTTEHLAGYDWTLTNVTQEPGPNYSALVATLEVRHNGKIVTIMHPSKRSFNSQNQTTTEVSIHTNLLADLYGVLGDKHGTDAAPTYVLRLHYNPLAPWMWLGALIMAIGGVLSLSDRRMRVGAPRRAKPTPNTVTAA